jgi:energy-coupling factor transport system ATP-binding protein
MINLQNTVYTYPGSRTAALRGVSFHLAPGEKTALMGANGSGKTTLVRCINGLLKPSGIGSVDGYSLNREEDLWEIRRRVGMVFQNPDNQIVATTVVREIAFGLENLGLSREIMHERVESALEKFHLQSLRETSPHLLSGGERQRLACASVWVMEPRYLILDEPTSLLDPQGREEIMVFIDEARCESNAGVLIVTQYPEEALAADRLLIMHAGRLIMDDSPINVFSHERRLKSLGLGVPVEVELDRLLGSAL